MGSEKVLYFTYVTGKFLTGSWKVLDFFQWKSGNPVIKLLLLSYYGLYFIKKVLSLPNGNQCHRFVNILVVLTNAIMVYVDH